jgi:hypothetical protein
MKFRKKPVVIEAITFEEFITLHHFSLDIVQDDSASDRHFDYKGSRITKQNDELYVIPTLEGNHNFTPQDMLITGVKGELYPCKIEIFNQTYDIVDERFDGDDVFDNVLETYKILDNTTSSKAKENVKDIKFWGDGDTFKLISKASSQSEGWMKSTKAMQIDGIGCIIQVTTQQGDNVAEAITFVPNVKIQHTIDCDTYDCIGRKIVSLSELNTIHINELYSWKNLL